MCQPSGFTSTHYPSRIKNKFSSSTHAEHSPENTSLDSLHLSCIGEQALRSHNEARATSDLRWEQNENSLSPNAVKTYSYSTYENFY